MVECGTGAVKDNGGDTEHVERQSNEDNKMKMRTREWQKEWKRHKDDQNWLC